jgi:hypothetical protein
VVVFVVVEPVELDVLDVVLPVQTPLPLLLDVQLKFVVVVVGVDAVVVCVFVGTLL